MVRGRGRVGCLDHQGRVGSGHMFIGWGGFGSPMIRSRSVPLSSLIRWNIGGLVRHFPRLVG